MTDARLNLCGQKFGRLTAVEPGATITTGVKPVTTWRCVCDCGKTLTVRTGALRNGHTQSCGCYNRDRVTSHGLTKSPTWKSWESAMQRCHNPNAPDFERYGGRGIEVCADWRSFDVFLRDMGLRPPGTTLDRIDNTKGYEPGNCRWATYREQGNNRRSCVMIEWAGRTQSLMAWCRELGLNYFRVRERLRAGRTVEDAFYGQKRGA